MFLNTSAAIQRIVTDDGTAIARISNVKLEAVAAVSERQIEGLNSVLTRVPGCTTMAQEEWMRVRQCGVSYPSQTKASNILRV